MFTNRSTDQPGHQRSPISANIVIIGIYTCYMYTFNIIAIVDQTGLSQRHSAPFTTTADGNF